MNNLFRLLKSKSLEELLFFLALCLVVFIVPQPIFSQNSEQIESLELDKPVDREIKGGQTHVFQITFADKQYAKIMVEQRGVDVVIRRRDSNGKISAEYDYDPRTKGDEPVEMTVNSAGKYQLTVEPKQKNAAAGRYEISIIEVRNANEEDFALDEARILVSEANRLWINSEYAKALPLAERALEIREKELGTENVDYCQALFAVANILSDIGELAKSEVFYKRVIQIREKVLGAEHISISSVQNNLATLYTDKGEYDKAEVLLERALKIREKELEPNHLWIASVLLNLGNISRQKGNIEKAKTYYERVLEIRENALGKESAPVAVILNNIANLDDDFSKAEPLYLRSLAIREKILGSENQEVAQTLYNLAILYAKAGNYSKAQQFGERSLAIFEKQLGPEHPSVSYPLNVLALVYKETGEWDKAESYYLRSIAIKEKTLGSYNPYLGGAISNLANLFAAKGEIDKAIEAQSRANEISEYNAALNLNSGSEKEKIEYLRTLESSENRTFTISTITAPNSSNAADLTATLILRRKGRVLDALADNLAALRRRFDQQDQLVLDKLSQTTSQLSKLVLEGPRSDSADEYSKKIKELEVSKVELEAEISRRSLGYYQLNKPINLQSVKEAVPNDAALIEISLCVPVGETESLFGLNEETESERYKQYHYLAYVIPKNGKVQWKDLGDAKLIDADIEAFRKALRDSKSKNIRQVARALDEKVISPIREFLGNTKQLLISPDGNLNLIPFEALVDEKGKYLVENYQVTYLTSGRDLLRMQTARKSKGAPLIVADPLFGEPPQLLAQNNSLKSPKTRGKTKSITATRDLTETYFAPLGGTLQEARSIKNLFPDAVSLTEAQATETALKQISSPSILHIATHGFFLEDADNSSKTIKESAKQEKGKNPKIENPLLRSGLALAGANERKSGADDGILTALEASGLNLWGTKLVVLSACDTGLGEVKNGEGVYGLRRAFVLAGTESLVMSLWSVSDYATRELMTNYYKNLKQGAGRGEALRQVQLEMLKNKGRQHPFYWASFIQSGEWANLDGKR